MRVLDHQFAKLSGHTLLSACQRNLMDAVYLLLLLRDVTTLADSICLPLSVYRMAVMWAVLSRSGDAPSESDSTHQRLRPLNFDYLRNSSSSSFCGLHASSARSRDPYFRSTNGVHSRRSGMISCPLRSSFPGKDQPQTVVAEHCQPTTRPLLRQTDLVRAP